VILSSNHLGQPHSNGFCLQSTWPLLLVLLPCGYPQETFQFLISPTSWGLYWSLVFILKASHIAVLWGTLSDFSGLPLKSGWKPLWLHNSCILHAYKTSIMWMMPSLLPAQASSPASLDQGFSGLWDPRQLTAGNLSPRRPYVCVGCPGACFSKQSFKWVKTFIPLILPWVWCS
jgi:hypothetical protein